MTVTIQGDGDLMYSPGVLWTCAHSRLPILYVVHNNRGYHQGENGHPGHGEPPPARY